MIERGRDERLLGLVREHGSVSVQLLSREIGVGPSSIRRDLRRLSRQGRLLRTYGGAAAIGQPGAADGAEQPRALSEKRRIAVAAARLISEGQTIAISSGSTTLELARQLVDRTELTVITNSLDVAQVLADREGIQLVILGGVVRPRVHSMLGHLTEQACAELRADTLFMGIGAVSIEGGLMNDYMPEILTDRTMRTIASRVVLLADSSKFERVEAARVFGLEEVATIVTDEGIDPSMRQELEARAIEVVIA